MPKHATHSSVRNRLKRVSGHLAKVIDMLESEEECLVVAQQLQAVVNALCAAKKIYVQDHIEHCLSEALSEANRNSKETVFEFKEIAKYL